MVFVWIVFIWAIIALLYFGTKWGREKKKETAIFKEEIERLKMSIGERLKRKERYKK